MVALHAMLLALAAVPSTAAEQNGDVCVETGTHHCKTEHLYLIQTNVDLFHRDTPVQPVVVATAALQPAKTRGNATITAAQPATTVVDAAGLSLSSTSNKCACAIIMVLSVSLAVLIWTQRGRFKNSSTPEKIATLSVVLFIVLTIAVHVLIRKFTLQGTNNAFQFSPAVMTLLIEVGKLLVMILGACVDWKNTRECSVAEFGKTLRLMSVPAACFATMNVLRYFALVGADLDQYRVGRSTDTIFVACFWFSMYKKTPGVNQITGISLVFLSCAIMAIQHCGDTSLGVVATLAAMGLLSSLGLVMNEFGLKASPQLSLFVQNVALYFLTTVMNSVVVLATVPTGQILQGIHSPQLVLVGLDVANGVCVACVLKYADAIVKVLASGWLTPLEPLVGHFLVNTPVTPTMVVATTLAGAGSIIYRLPEASPTSKKEHEDSSKQSATKQSGSKESAAAQ